MTRGKAPRCAVIRSGEAYEGKQGLTYLAGLTGASVGTRAICMTVLTLPPGARAKTHLHRGIETAAYVIEGEAAMAYGPRLEDRLAARAGDYVYVPADTPHLVFNPTDAPCVAVVAHTAADDQEGIVLLPELDGLV
ncbi:MAG: cupin domain-containing protein [Hyphomicrobiales bacterium]